jgi:hypothetical protein
LVGDQDIVRDPASGITIRGSDSAYANWPVLAPSAGSSVRGIHFNSTTAKTNITIKYMKWDYSNVTTAMGCVSAGSAAPVTNLTVEDFECKGPPVGQAHDNAAGFGPGQLASGWTVRRGKVHRWHSADGNPGAHGFYWAADNGTIEHVEITDLNGYFIQYYRGGADVNGNVFRYNWGHDRNYAGQGGISTGNGTSSATGTKIYSNIFSNVGGTRVISGGRHMKLWNNTIYATSGGVGVTDGYTTCEIINNIILVATPNSSSCTTVTTNRTTGTPTDIMIAPASNNFSLKESSAAIDAGTVISGFSAGLYVGSAPDQGALEAPIRSATASVEDGDASTYRVTFSLPTQSTGGNGSSGVGLQTCTVGNFAMVVAGGGATESSCAITGTNRVDVTLGSAVTNGQSLTDAMTRTTAPTLMDNVAIGYPHGTLGTNYHNAYVRTYSATSATNNVGAAPSLALTQSHFRFHKLRGTEDAPALICATCTEDVAVSTPPGAAFRLRVKFRTNDDPPGTTYKLRYSKDGGAYTDIPDAFAADGIAWYGATADADIPAAGTPTTEQLTSDEASNTVCAVIRTSSDYPLLDLNNSETECEYAVKISTSVAATSTFDFRVYKGDDTALDTYTVTPRLIVGNYVMAW